MPARVWIRKCRRPGARVPWEHFAVVTDSGQLLGYASGCSPTHATAIDRAEADVMHILTADDDRLELAAFRAMTLAGY